MILDDLENREHAKFSKGSNEEFEVLKVIQGITKFGGSIQAFSDQNSMSLRLIGVQCMMM